MYSASSLVCRFLENCIQLVQKNVFSESTTVGLAYLSIISSPTTAKIFFARPTSKESLTVTISLFGLV